MSALEELPQFDNFEYSENDFPCPCPLPEFFSTPCPTYTTQTETPYLSHTEVPVLNQVEDPIPDAYTLILQKKSRDTGRIMGSATVRGLVERLRDFDLQGYVPLDPAMTLTVADINTIERLGYYISSSGFSVHPYLHSC